MLATVPAIESAKEIAAGALKRGARITVVAAGATYGFVAAAHRALSAGKKSVGFEVSSAALYFDDGCAVDFPARTAEKIVAFNVGWLGNVDESEAPRLEVRYVLDGKKFRAIAGRRIPKIVVGGRPRAPKILAVELVSKGGFVEDVTGRVLKYMGPGGDFHGVPVRVADMFPNRDVEAMEVAGYSIAVTDRMMNEKVVPFSGSESAADVLSA
jgi:hypothetical protein